LLRARYVASRCFGKLVIDIAVSVSLTAKIKSFGRMLGHMV
jgi:hypothetical protein